MAQPETTTAKASAAGRKPSGKSVLGVLRRVAKDLVNTIKEEKKSANGILSEEDQRMSEADIKMESVIASVIAEYVKPRLKYGVEQSYRISAWLQKHGKVIRPRHMQYNEPRYPLLIQTTEAPMVWQHEKRELNELQVAQLQECFQLMDTDGSGSIDEAELRESFKLLGLKMSKAAIKDIFSEVDYDCSGSVCFQPEI